MSAAFIARQPIFNPKLDVVGYELLFRGQGYAAGALIDDGQDRQSVQCEPTASQQRPFTTE